METQPFIDQDATGSFLDTDAAGRAGAVDPLGAERPGTLIGPYKLLQPIGEGGMGSVFLAEQTHPVQRQVALKVIKAGMDSGQVIARFEAERQALAMMDHPHIAKVLDAGTTAAGRPYFVMELVRGVPITTYCDENQLAAVARLELFTQVCRAVQHAHNKGLIHRDLKPGNVLVARYDDKPASKVIDFGVAKATGGQLSERTMYTGFGQIVGTLEYMSPEQAQFDALDIDTRSDIYSLGVILYELLTGTTPFEKRRLRQTGFVEVLRLIREEDPPKPSTRLRMQSAEGRERSERHTPQSAFRTANWRELDWIVMKALEKDRNLRYESANALAADIERYLHDEPVQACPPSAAYRFRKFALRNKRLLTAGALVAASLVVAVGGIGWAVRDRAAQEEQSARQREAREAKTVGQLGVILDDVAKLQREEKWPEALLSARRAEAALAAGEAPEDIEERARQVLAELEFVQRLEDIRAQSGSVWGYHAGERKSSAQADQSYASAFREFGIDIDSLPRDDAASRIMACQGIAPVVLPAIDDWIAVRSKAQEEPAVRRLTDLLAAADPDAWRQKVRNMLAGKDWAALKALTTSKELDRQPAATLCFLSSALRANGQSAQAGKVLRRAQWKFPDDFWISHRLGISLIYTNAPDSINEGMGYMRAAVALRPQSEHAIMNLGVGYNFLGRADQAIACYRKAIELKPKYPAAHANLGTALRERGQYQAAITALETALGHSPDHAAIGVLLANALSFCPQPDQRDPSRAVALARRAVDSELSAGTYWNSLGAAHYRAGQFSEAKTALEESARLGPGSSSGAAESGHIAIDGFFLSMTLWQLGEHDQARQQYAQAATWMDAKAPKNEELRRFRTEAAQLLGLPIASEPMP